MTPPFIAGPAFRVSHLWWREVNLDPTSVWTTGPGWLTGKQFSHAARRARVKADVVRLGRRRIDHSARASAARLFGLTL